MVGTEGETFSNHVSTVSERTKTFLSVICCSQKLACTSVKSFTVQCSAVHNYDSLCRRSSRSPIMLSILLVYIIGRAGASPPSLTAAIIFLYVIFIAYLAGIKCFNVRARG